MPESIETKLRYSLRQKDWSVSKSVFKMQTDCMDMPRSEIEL